MQSLGHHSRSFPSRKFPSLRAVGIIHFIADGRRVETRRIFSWSVGRGWGAVNPSTEARVGGKFGGASAAVRSGPVPDQLLRRRSLSLS